MPPEAFTPIDGPTTRRMSATSFAVAPEGPKPVEVFTKSAPASLESVLGWLLAPVAWLIGIPWKDASHIGSLLGIRMVGNELIAYGQLGVLKPQLDTRSFTIATYALCGFANLSSIGIQIGGIGALAPSRKEDLAKLGFRAMLAGTMANLISAAIVGIMT